MSRTVLVFYVLGYISMAIGVEKEKKIILNIVYCIKPNVLATNHFINFS